MTEEYDLKPFTFKADKTKPARIVQKLDGSLEIWFYDEDGNLRKMPVVVSVLPGEVVDTILGNSLTSSLTGKILEAQGLAPYPLTSKTITYNDASSLSTDITSPTGWFWVSNDYTTPGYMEVKFVGTKFGLFLRKFSSAGKANIYVDGVLVNIVDLYGSFDHWELYYKDGFEDKEHVLKIEVSSDKNPSSSNYYVEVGGLYFEAGKNPVQDIDYWNRQKLLDIYNKLLDVINVDTLASESAVSGEIDTSSETSPITVLTPSSGKKIDTRGVYIFTDSGAGEVTASFPSSGITLAKIYASKFARVDLPMVRFTGAIDEGIEISWSGLGTGAKIFYIIRYKEI